MLNRKHSYPIAPLCVLGFLWVVLLGCKNDLDAAKKISSRANVNIERGKDVEILYSSGGANKVKAKAKTVLRFNAEKPYMEFPDGVEVKFYANDGSVETIMKAKYAYAREGSSLMTARRNVEVVNEKGEKLDTEELIWDESRKKIYSNSQVKITTNDEIILGKGFESDETFSDYTIKNITGKLKVNSEELP